MNIKLDTINKALQFLEKLSESNRIVDIYDTVREYRLSANTVQALVKLNYVTKLERGIYYPNFEKKDVEPIMARNLIEKTYSINYSYKGGNKKEESKKVEIKDFSDIKLVEELRRRGYEGELVKTTVNKLKV